MSLVLREPAGAIERHVLDEVRGAQLVVVFQNRPGVHNQPQLGAPCGRALRRMKYESPFGSRPARTSLMRGTGDDGPVWAAADWKTAAPSSRDTAREPIRPRVAAWVD